MGAKTCARCQPDLVFLPSLTLRVRIDLQVNPNPKRQRGRIILKCELVESGTYCVDAVPQASSGHPTSLRVNRAEPVYNTWVSVTFRRNSL